MAHLPIFPHELGRVQPLEPQAEQYIKEIFWPHSRSSVAEYASYFRYFQWAISVLAWPEGIIHRENFAIQTYGDIAKIVRVMELDGEDTRLVIAQKLQIEFPGSSPGQILRSLDLTARLWLTLHVRSEDYPVGPSLSDITEVPWTEKASLRATIQDCFPSSSYSASGQEARIDPEFTIQNLHKLCRVKVQWTANLKDHLSYDRPTSTLHLFPHKICLISHLESCNILPKDLVSETLRTLDLLFPFGNESTQKYLDKTSQSFYRTSSRDLSRAVEFGEFRYWRKRLIELHEVFNQAPRSILQMWHDRRNPIQWWTFWLAAAIAVLTITFGVIASYTGFRQVSLAEKAYQLSLLQACSQSNPLADICK
ncbi:hypothetical protein MMC28_000660 [Mycoblastus sanguinarius]|nr:hypothetical protein [Mycoblastus sanguinarius]